MEEGERKFIQLGMFSDVAILHEHPNGSFSVLSLTEAAASSRRRSSRKEKNPQT